MFADQLTVTSLSANLASLSKPNDVRLKLQGYGGMMTREELSHALLRGYSLGMKPSELDELRHLIGERAGEQLSESADLRRRMLKSLYETLREYRQSAAGRQAAFRFKQADALGRLCYINQKIGAGRVVNLVHDVLQICHLLRRTR